MPATARRTRRIAVVLDAARDLSEAGYDRREADDFAAAYSAAADTLARAVNRRLGGHRLRIDVRRGSYEGPAMLDDDQPEGIEVWQGLHDMLRRDDAGRWCVRDVNPALAACLRDWMLGTED